MSPTLCLVQRRLLLIPVLVAALFASACSYDPVDTASASGDAASESASSSVESDTSTTSTTTEAPPDTDAADTDAAATDESTTEAPTTDAPADEEPDTEATEGEEAASEAAVAVDYGPPASLVADCSAVGSVSVGLGTGTVNSGNVTYTYQWTVPSTYDGTPIPVVLDFRGIGSSGAEQAFFGGWAAKAEAEGFLAVQPTGTSVPGDDRASWELPQFETDDRDDIAFVIDLLDHVAQSVCIDPARVYATGMSNGGLFTSTLVCSLSQRIAAAVSVAGVTHHETCEPVRAVPYLAFHGTDDTVVPYSGGGESTLSGADGSSEFFEQVMPDEFAEFASSFNCDSSTDEAITPEVTLRSYSGCDDDVPVGFYTITGGGHTWPGSPVSAAIASLGVTNMDISATDVAWEFFQQHALG